MGNDQERIVVLGSPCFVTTVTDIEAWDETNCPNSPAWVGIMTPGKVLWNGESWACSDHFWALHEYDRILSVNEYWREHDTRSVQCWTATEQQVYI